MQQLIKICKCDCCGCDIETDKINVRKYDLRRVGLGFRVYDLCDDCLEEHESCIAEYIRDRIHMEFKNPEGRKVSE